MMLGRLVAVLVRIAEALEASANRPQTEPVDSELRAWAAKASLGMQAQERKIAELEQREPPSASLIERMARMEIELEKTTRLLNSTRSRFYREEPKHNGHDGNGLGPGAMILGGPPP
jgi:hypothetical protein